MPWKLDGMTLLGFSLAAEEDSRAIGKYVDSREIPEDMDDDHLGEDELIFDDYESLIHVDAPSDLSSFPDTEDLNFISESNSQNFLRFKFGELEDISAKIEIMNMINQNSTDF